MSNKSSAYSNKMNKIFVLKNHSRKDVADAMIDSGNQREQFYLQYLDEVAYCVRYFREKMPRVQLFYAMKCNDDIMMTKMVIALGCGFDCASPGEIYKIKSLNVDPRSIIYAMPVKSPEQMTYARESGVRHTTFDSSCELKKLKMYWPDARLLIRIKIESECLYKLGDKFGCQFSEAVGLLEEAATLNLHVVGVAFHVGSACFSKQSYETGLAQAKALFDHERQQGRRLSILDIGGGFITDDSDFDEVADIINRGLNELFPETDIQIIAEPGRFLCETAFTYYSNINDVKTVVDSGKPYNMIYINNGKNGDLKWIESWQTVHKHKKILQDDNPVDSIIWGPTIDNRDRLDFTKFPPCSPQEWLVFTKRGSYAITFTSNFCGFSEPRTRYVISWKLWNHVKYHPVFASDEFLLDSDISSPLSSTLPPIAKLINNEIELKDSLSTYVLDRTTSEDVARSMIDNRQTQPFFVFNMDEAYQRILYFKYKMPRVKMFYGIKANATDPMLKLCVAAGVGFNCASPGEIYTVLQLHVDPKNILYGMPIKTPEQMKYARDAGIQYTVFDSAYQLKKLKENWPNARLLIRIKIDNTKKLQEKFGCDFKTEATTLLDQAASFDMTVVGVSFDTGDICVSTEEYIKGLRVARRLFDHETSAGRTMTHLDIGGGFLGDQLDRIDQVSDAINKTLEDLFPEPSIKILADPGRYLCESAFTMYCSVAGVKRIIKDNRPVNMIYLNEGVYGTMRFAETWHKISKFKRSTESNQDEVLEEAILWGPTCDALDRVMEEFKVLLPPCSVMDWLVVENYGGYTFTHATTFSSMKIPLIRNVVSKTLWLTLKNKSIFKTNDFVLKPDISTPLPSTLPPIITHYTQYHGNIPILKL